MTQVDAPDGEGNPQRQELMAAARRAAEHAYAPYSRFHVGAALRFADGAVVTGANVENASYGLSICAETVAVARALSEGRRTGLVAVAVFAAGSAPVTPCGRCRQVLMELAQLGGTDPVVWACGSERVHEHRLSALLPAAFGPASLEP
jgi:cytidine deaminase